VRGRRIAAVALSAVLVASVAGGATYALWSTDAEASIGVLRSGDLDLELVGGVHWAETSPGLTGHRIDSGAGGAADHLAVPGDSFTVAQRFRTTLEGDNLRAQLSVRWLPATSVPAGVAGTYVVRSGSQVVSGPTQLGTPVTLPPARLGSDVSEWEVVATVVWGGSDRVVPPAALAAPPATSVNGALQLDLQQVRAGDGFTTP